MNERYIAYLASTNKPTNWGFMAFINRMKVLYIGDLYGHIVDHDKFTVFIEERVKEVSSMHNEYLV